MKAILTSIVIPCYNGGEHLMETVDSGLSQSYENVEVIVVNDGSTDPETLTVFDKLPPNVRVLHKENGHLSSARNYGINSARGEYILLLDAGDYFHSTFVEKAVAIMEKNDQIGMVASWVQYFGDQNHVARTKEGTLTDFLVKNTNCGNLLVRKRAWEVAGGYDENMKKGLEDWNFTISVLSKGYTLKVIPEPLFFYRKEGESMSTESRAMKPKLFMQIVNNHRQLFVDNMDEILYGKEAELSRLSALNDKLGARIVGLEKRIEQMENSFCSKVRHKITKLFRRNDEE